MSVERSPVAGGEILVTEAGARVAGVFTADTPDRAERPHFDLRGMTEATDVFVLTLGGAA